jgi:translation initiation factor 3 subunit H
VAPLLEKNLEFLNDCLDDLMVEQGKLSMYQNNMRRQQQAIAQFKMQRRQENMTRRAAGGCWWAGRRLGLRVCIAGCMPFCTRSSCSTSPLPPACLASAGEEALSEEPPEGMFKPVAEPNQLDNMLLSNQMASYCQHINSATQQALSKLTLMEGLQKAL